MGSLDSSAAGTTDTEAEAASMSMYRGGQSIPITATAEYLLEKSTRKSTKTKYESISRKWIRYCREKGYECMAADTTVFINSIGDEFDRGLKYSTLRSYISALSVFKPNVDPGTVKKVLKGVFNTCPQKQNTCPQKQNTCPQKQNTRPQKQTSLGVWPPSQIWISAESYPV